MERKTGAFSFSEEEKSQVEMIPILVTQELYQIFSKLAEIKGISTISEIQIAFKEHIESNKHLLQ